jgi:hypothetical protein
MYSEIAHNNRRSVLIIALFFIIWVGIGALGGLVFKAVATSSSNNSPYGPPTHYGSAPIFTGMAICAVLALLGIVYSLTSGARMVLRVSGAVPADPQKVPTDPRHRRRLSYWRGHSQARRLRH